MLCILALTFKQMNKQNIHDIFFKYIIIPTLLKKQPGYCESVNQSFCVSVCK